MKRRPSPFVPLVALLAAGMPLVGGQAVLEGVMMRNAEAYGLAVRLKGGIRGERRRWSPFMSDSVRKIRFVRGFPVLMETLVNGVKTLNRSAILQGEADEKPIGGWQLAATVGVAILFALFLALVLPHGLTWLLSLAGVSGDVSGLSFQIWDGVFKILVLVGYMLIIGRLPEIRRLFQYHGAEHKTIHAFETGRPVDVELAAAQSRFHPRCGTTFILVSALLSVLCHAALVPLLLHFWTPESDLARHAGTVLFKVFLLVPVASVSYEALRAAARLTGGACAVLLQAPGLLLQRLTTVEPEREHLEVALVALKEALGAGSGYEVSTVPYGRL